MNDTVLVTGCNGGIGSGIVTAFADAGWFVIGMDQTAHRKDLKTNHFIQADLASLSSDEKKLKTFAGDVRGAFGDRPFRTLINNAAVQSLGSVDELTYEAMLSSMNVNAIAPFMLVKTFCSDLEAAKGSVINIGSVHAQATKPGFSAYAASKSALHGLTRALALDLGPKNIRVNTLAPAATATPMLKAGFAGNDNAFAALENVHPLQRIAEPDEIARVALFLASNDASFMTGATLYADGGILSRLHDTA